MEEKIPIYTDLKIIPRDKGGIDKYFSSIKRNLPNDWMRISDHNYNDQDTFYILDDIICLRSPYFKNVSEDVVFYGAIFLGLTAGNILLLRIELRPEISKENSIEPIGYIINKFHEEILKPNKYYEWFDHEFKFGGPSDENWYKQDIRSQRQIRFNSKEQGKIYSLIKGTQAQIRDKKVFFNEPNNISLCLSIMKKSYKNAQNLYAKLKLNSNNTKIEIKEEALTKLYDYFEEVITGLTFSYISVESIANAAIPEDYTYEKINDKGIKETWPKESIERWMSTSRKVSEILPSVLQSTNIKEELFWPRFKELEILRNNIVHQKTIEKGTKLDSEIFKELIDPSIFGKIKSSLEVIGFFYNIDNAHPYFHLGLGLARFKIQDIESMDKYFKVIEK